MTRRPTKSRGGVTSAKAMTINTSNNIAPTSTGVAPLPGNGTVGIATQISLWQGQFPPPEAVQVYEQVLPGAFDRLMTMAEKQQDAVIDASKVAMALQQKDVRRGQVLGAVVTLTCIGAAVYCAHIGHPAVAAVLVAVPIMAVPIALIQGSRTRAEVSTPETSEERPKKKKS